MPWLSRVRTAGLPPSAHVCDVACVAFALWTLCAQAVVAAGGTLGQLVGLYALAGAATLVVWWVRRRRPRPEPEAEESTTPPPPRRRGLHVLQGVGLVIGVGAALVFHLRGDVMTLWAVAVALLGVAALFFVLLEPPLVRRPARGATLEIGLWGLALACVAVTLACHRPDIDDAFYVNLAVTAVDSPGQPLLAGDTLHGAADLPLLLPIYRLHSYELWNGMLAWLSGRPAIEIFHWVAASLAALLVPLAFAQAFRWLAPREWLWATVAVVFVLLAAGETHRWYGNFAFVRMWQGKGIYLFVFVPLVYAYAIELGLRPSAGAWMRLAAAQIAAVGCTSSALWGAPVASLVALCCVVRPTREGLRIFATGAVASLYVLAIGWIARATMMSGGHTPAPRRLVEEYTGARLEEALGVALGTERLLAVGVAALLASWALCRRGLGQRFAIVVPLAVTVVLLNPVIGTWVLQNVTGSSYWRGMWALPVPMLIAFVLISPLQLAREGASRWIAAGASLALMAAFAGFVPAFAALSERNGGSSGVGIRVGRPGLKVDEVGWRWARALNAAVPAGSVVIAPSEVSVWLPTFHQHARPVEVRPAYLRHYRDQLGNSNIRLRHLLTRFVRGSSQNPNDAAIFRRALDRLGVRGVCLRLSSRTPETRRILREVGFELRTRATDHEIWVRDDGI